MDRLRSASIPLTTDGSGAASVDFDFAITGGLYAVEWVVGTMDATVDVTLSVQGGPAGAKTVLTLTNAAASARYYPRDVMHDATGTALTGTSGGDRTLPVIDGKPRVVIAQGGAAKTGTLVLYYLV